MARYYASSRRMQRHFRIILARAEQSLEYAQMAIKILSGIAQNDDTGRYDKLLLLPSPSQ